MTARAIELQKLIATVLTGETTEDVVATLALVNAGTALMLTETPEAARAWLHILAEDASRQAEFNWPKKSEWMEIQQRMAEAHRA